MRRTILSAASTSRQIGVTAASTLVPEAALRDGVQRFAKWGYPVRMDDSVFSRERYFAGNDAMRSEALMRLIKDSNVGTIWCARGGYGATRILGLLDQARAAAAMTRDPKLLVGFSDVTALHFYFWEKCRLASLHAPMPATARWGAMPSRVEKILRGILAGDAGIGRNSHTADWKMKQMVGGSAEGVLLGGNLTLLDNLVGTPWQPNLKGAILFLEDCGEVPYRIDRILTHLENSGMLRGLAGVLLGDFEEGVVYREPAGKKHWKGIFTERFAGLGVPVLTGVPVGHGAKNEPLPLGVRARITRAGGLELLEQVVKK